MPNALKDRLGRGEPCVNGWLAIPSGFSAEVVAQCGFDSVTVDLQHGVQDYRSTVQCFQAMGAHPVTPMARVPSNAPGIVGKVLDAGAWGVICPMVNTVAEARAFASACLYPPSGTRSNGPIRAAASYGKAGEYQGIANDEILVIPMIETRQAVDEVEAILEVPGVSGIYVGPSDLAFSLGMRPALDHEDDDVLAIYERLVRHAAERGKFAGIHTGGATYAARMLDLGFGLVTVSNDSGLLAKAAREAVRDTQNAVGARRRTPDRTAPEGAGIG